MERATRVLPLLFAVCLLIPAGAHPATVDLFSPQGPVKKVRQAAARFSEQMVAFGDPRLSDPFDVACAVPGKGGWADARNWVYDFDEDLPAGLLCTFTLKPSVRTLAGVPDGMIPWRPEPGAHTLALVDGDGSVVDTVVFRVRGAPIAGQ